MIPFLFAYILVQLGQDLLKRKDIIIFICTHCISVIPILNRRKLNQSKRSSCPHCFNVKSVLNQCYLKQCKSYSNKVPIGSICERYFEKVLCSNFELMFVVCDEGGGETGSGSIDRLPSSSWRRRSGEAIGGRRATERRCP